MASGNSLASLQCLVCRELYATGILLPKVLQCGHTFCSTCIGKLNNGGCRIICPICNSCHNLSRKDDDVPINFVLLDMIGFSEMKSTCQHDTFASSFCETHFQALCKKCSADRGHSLLCRVPINGPDNCRFWKIPYNGSNIRSYLCEQIDQIPSNFPLNQSSMNVKRAPNSSSLDDLFRVLLWTKMPPCQCKIPGKYVNMRTLEMYCETCKEEQAEAIEFTLKFTTGVMTVIIEALKQVHFYRLNDKHIFFLSPEALTCNYLLTDLLAIGQEIMSFQEESPLDISEYPEEVYCPGCSKRVSKQELRMRLLPCSNAIHAACEQCLEKNECRICPIDRKEYGADIFDLPAIIGRNRVLADNPLAGKGYLMPAFKRQSNLPPLLTALDLFVDVLPSRPKFSLNRAYAFFNQPWKANSVPNQVECITFRPLFRTVIIRGFGIGSTLKETQEAIISSVKLYRNSHAAGPSFQDIPLLSSKLGREQPLCTDIYFQNGVKVTIGEAVTLKITIAPANSIVELFHGNHLGAYESPQGGDKTTFEVLPTKSLEPGERLAGSQCLSPLLRLIYESSA